MRHYAAYFDFSAHEDTLILLGRKKADEDTNRGAVLQAALRQVAPERPYRGPSTFRQGIYSYVDKSEGDVHRFSGIEAIARGDEIVYQLRYSGGVLR